MWVKIGAVLGVLVPVAGFVWYLATHDAFANEESKKQKTMSEAVQMLTEIHVRQETVEQAEKNLKLRLCADGKLVGADCIEEK
jgi:hypothetical protein